MNLTLFYFLHSFAFQYVWLDKLIWFFAVPFIYIVIVGVGVYFFIEYDLIRIRNLRELLQGKARVVVRIFFSAGLAYGIASILKRIIHTDRPFIALMNVHSLFIENDYAFPSGHSATIAGLAFAVYFRHKRLGYLCMAVALLVGLARVVAGVHFPIDILGGYVIGFIVAYFSRKL